MGNEQVERVVVTVDDQHISNIQSVASALRLAGMQVESVMSTVGIITGEVSTVNVQAIRKIPGVSSVEPDQEMHAI